MNDFDRIDGLSEKALFQLQTVKKLIESINDQLKQIFDEGASNAVDEAVKRIDEGDARKCTEEYREFLNIMVAENISSPVVSGYVRKVIGLCYYRLQEWQEAADELLAYIKDEPGDAEALFSIASCYQKLKNHKEAAEYFEGVVRVDPRNPAAFCNWGVALKLLYNNTRDVECLRQAIEKYRRAEELNPDYYDAVHNQATALEDLHIETKELDCLRESIKKYEQAIEIKPDFSQPHFNFSSALIYLFHALKKPAILDDALKHGYTVIELDPHDKNIYYNIACAYSLKEMKAQMMDALEKVIESDSAHKKLAREDRDLAKYHDDPDFITLTEEDDADMGKSP